MNPTHIVDWQPERPRIDEATGKVLMYRTRPKFAQRMMTIHTHAVQICMMALYRAARRGDIPEQVAIDDLYKWIATGHFSKRVMGTVVVNSVIYEPRVYVNRKSTGALMTYSFGDVKELEYGLEWMICFWLRKYLNRLNADDQQIKTKGEMAEELNFLADASDDEFDDVYIGDLSSFMIEPVDWLQHSEDWGWEFREELPEPEKPHPLMEEKVPPRDIRKMLRDDTTF